MFSKIISDSSSNLFAMEGVEFASVALKIHTAEQEYVDTPALDLDGMIEDLRKNKGKSGSSCPNIHDWTQAFGEADRCYCITISSHLSGSYSAAIQAAEEYMSDHPGRKVAVFDSLSAGPELALVAEKIKECIANNMSFEDTAEAVSAYQKSTHTLFCLQSLTNLARNGRISPAVAKIAGVLGIRIIGRGSDEGTLEMLHKSRGERKALDTLLSEMEKNGLDSGKVIISHCQCAELAAQLKALILARHPQCPLEITPCGALCSFYAERGGLIIGYEGK